MKKSPIPDEVKYYILDSVPSIPYLEAMLLMKSQLLQQWDIDTLSKRLFITKNATEQVVKQLLLSGIIKSSENDTQFYYFHPIDDKLNTLIDQLGALYITNLVEITNMVHSRNEQSAAQKFSEAFMWRKDK
jgi:hypothetical protein